MKSITVTCFCGLPQQNVAPMGVGDGETGSRAPSKNREKYFSRNYYLQFGHLRAKIM